MGKEKLFFGFAFVCFYLLCIAKGTTDIERFNSSEILEAAVKSDKNVTEHCTSNIDCNNRRCVIRNGIGVCKCWEGFIGDDCSEIEACVQNPDMCGDDPQTQCAFSWKFREAYCRCKSRSKRFDVETKTCVDKKSCERSLKQCENEGYCAKKSESDQYEEENPENENITYCECPLGTSGDFCERVEECVKRPNYCGDGKDVKCRMNPRINKIYCLCQDSNQRFDWEQKKCVDREECLVNEDCLPHGLCTDKCQDYEPCISHENIENKRSCHCVEGTSGHKCRVIDECFNKIVDCGHDAACVYYYYKGLGAYTYCECNNRSLVFDDLDKTCKVCDCGPMGANCDIDKGERLCTCKEGSYNLGDRCQACECGDGSRGCKFDGVKKTCLCKYGYVELNGICERCDCGMHSTGCRFDDEGKKICTCEAGFKEGNYSVCTPMCNDRDKCANGGLCLQDICVCLAGTGGPYCETVYECESKLCGIEQESQSGNDAEHMVRCEYDTKIQKAYCRCRLGYFDPVEKVCKACECGDPTGEIRGICEIYDGQKVCRCFPGFSYNPVSTLCDSCDCGFGNCSFDSNGGKICKCEEGFLSYKGACKKCDCGLHGTCRHVTLAKGEPMKVCSCDAGYEEFKGTCLKCDCSPNGKCSFSSDGNSQKCICDPGFQEFSGKCKLCDCGPNSIGCSFSKNTKSLLKVCNCLRGFKEEKGYCRDINECLDTEICSDPGTECENTIGSFKCRCQSGYVPKNVRVANETSLCQKEEEKKPDDKGWKIGYGVLSAVFIAIFIGLVVVIFKIRK